MWTLMNWVWRIAKWFSAILRILVLHSFNHWIFCTTRVKVGWSDHFAPIVVLWIDVTLLKQFSQPTENKNYIKECIQRDHAFLRHAVRCKWHAENAHDPCFSLFRTDPWARAIVYATFSKNKSENEDVVQTIVDEQNDQRSPAHLKKDIGVYK